MHELIMGAALYNLAGIHHHNFVGVLYRAESVGNDQCGAVFQQTLEGRLNNPGYAQKAPPAMVKQTQDQLAKAKADRDAANAALAALGSNT